MNQSTLNIPFKISVANDKSTAPHGSSNLNNHSIFEKFAYFNQERILERVVYARGVGAFGAFTLNKSLSEYTAASFLQTVGEKTNLFVRFSNLGGGQDSNDFERDAHGFAVKFYTHQGNFDMVGNNTPVFFSNDPINFSDFVQGEPYTDKPNAAQKFDFWAAHPQSLHKLTILMSDRGIPASYRHIHGFSPHTLSFSNKEGERFWVKWHFKTDQGIKTLTNDEAALMPSFGAQKDLVDAIDRKDFPRWTVQVQIMPEAQAASYKLNPFDLTKIWPHADYPVIEIGTLELNRNIDNYFAKTEQIPFTPNNLVPGLGATPDKIMQAKYQNTHSLVDHFSQAGDLFRLMAENQKQQLIKNIVDGLCQATDVVQQQMIEQFTKADADYGQRVKSALQNLR